MQPTTPEQRNEEPGTEGFSFALPAERALKLTMNFGTRPFAFIGLFDAAGHFATDPIFVIETSEYCV